MPNDNNVPEYNPNMSPLENQQVLQDYVLKRIESGGGSPPSTPKPTSTMAGGTSIIDKQTVKPIEPIEPPKKENVEPPKTEGDSVPQYNPNMSPLENEQILQEYVLKKGDTWKPDFTKPNPWEGMPSDYAGIKTFVPSPDSPLPPWLNQKANEHGDVYNLIGRIVTVEELNQIAELPNDEAQFVAAFDKGLIPRGSQFVQGGLQPKTGNWSYLTPEQIQSRKDYELQSEQIRQQQDQIKINQEAYDKGKALFKDYEIPPSVGSEETNYGVQKIISAVALGQISEKDIGDFLGEDALRQIQFINAQAKQSKDLMSDVINNYIQKENIQVVDKDKLSIPEMQKLIEVGLEPQALVIQGQNIDNVNDAVKAINDKNKAFIEAQSKLEPYITPMVGVWSEKYPKPPENTIENLAKFQRENPDDSTSIRTLYGSDLANKVSEYNQSLKDGLNEIDQFMRSEELGSKGIAIDNIMLSKDINFVPKNTEYDLKIGSVKDTITDKILSPKDVLARKWDELSESQKELVLNELAKDPTKGNLFAALNRTIQITQEKGGLIPQVLFSGVSPITDVVAKQLTIDDARKILSDSYSTELNATKDFINQNGTVNLDGLRDKLNSDASFKEQLLKDSGYENTDDLIKNLEYYNNGIYVTKGEWANAGVVGALDVLALGGASALSSLGRVGRVSASVIPIGAGIYFTPSSIKTVMSPNVGVAEKVLAGATPIMLIAGGAVGLKAPKVVGEGVIPKVGIKTEIPIKINPVIEGALKEVSVSGKTTGVIASIKALPEVSITKVNLALENVNKVADSIMSGDAVNVVKNTLGDVSDKSVNILMDGAKSLDDATAIIKQFMQDLKRTPDIAIDGLMKSAKYLDDTIIRAKQVSSDIKVYITSGLPDKTINALMNGAKAFDDSIAKVQSLLNATRVYIIQRVPDYTVNSLMDKAKNLDDIVSSVKQGINQSKDYITQNLPDKAVNSLMDSAEFLDKSLDRVKQYSSDIKSYINEDTPDYIVNRLMDRAKNIDDVVSKIKDNITQAKIDITDKLPDKAVNKLMDAAESLDDILRNTKYEIIRLRSTIDIRYEDIIKALNDKLDNLNSLADKIISGEASNALKQQFIKTSRELEGDLIKAKIGVSRVYEKSLDRINEGLENINKLADDIMSAELKNREPLIHFNYLKKVGQNLKDDFTTELKIADLELGLKNKLNDIQSRLNNKRITELQAEVQVVQLKQTPEWLQHKILTQDLANKFWDRTSEYYAYRVSKLDYTLESIMRKLFLGDEIARMTIPYDLKWNMSQGDTSGFNGSIEQLKLKASELPRELREGILNEIDEVKSYGDEYIKNQSKEPINSTDDINKTIQGLEHENNELDAAKRAKDRATDPDRKRIIDDNIAQRQRSIERKKLDLAEKTKVQTPLEDVIWPKEQGKQVPGIIRETEIKPSTTERVVKRVIEQPSEKPIKVVRESEIAGGFILPSEGVEQPYWAIVFENGEFTYKLITPTELTTGKIIKLSENDSVKFKERVQELLRSMTYEQAVRLVSEEFGRSLSESTKSIEVTKLSEQVKPLETTQLETKPLQFEQLKPLERTQVQTEPQTQIKEEQKKQQEEQTKIKFFKLPKIESKVPEKFTQKRVLPGSLTWRQGAVWKIIEPPYGKDNFYTIKNPPSGVYKFATGPGSAYLTLQAIGGKPPSDVDVDLGWAKVHIGSKRGQDLEIKFLEGETANVDRRLPKGADAHAEYEDNPEEIKTKLTYQQPQQPQYSENDLRSSPEYEDVGLRPQGMPDTLIEKIPKGVSIKKEVPRELRKTELPQYRSGRLKVYTIDGEWLRNQNVPMSPDKTSIDWGGGGHAAVYPLLVPKNEIWIDRKFGLIDGKAYLLHELKEYRTMKGGTISYEVAHSNYANPLEVEGRKNINELDNLIKNELNYYSQGRLKPQKIKKSKVVEESYNEPIEPIKNSYTPRRVEQRQQIMIAEPTYLGHKIRSPELGGVRL
jgi:hypothetical protein